MGLHGYMHGRIQRMFLHGYMHMASMGNHVYVTSFFLYFHVGVTMGTWTCNSNSWSATIEGCPMRLTAEGVGGLFDDTDCLTCVQFKESFGNILEH